MVTHLYEPTPDERPAYFHARLWSAEDSIQTLRNILSNVPEDSIIYLTYRTSAGDVSHPITKKLLTKEVEVMAWCLQQMKK